MCTLKAIPRLQADRSKIIINNNKAAAFGCLLLSPEMVLR